MVSAAVGPMKTCVNNCVPQSIETHQAQFCLNARPPALSIAELLEPLLLFDSPGAFRKN
ncbi:hypothetical protein NC652_020347 [Populus alba x Populus x berolinensis]|nr:hypothetical protein NC652_020347 [Populus alba x Populus x berolinensis]